MAKPKKGKLKITDITKGKTLTEKEMKGVSGGFVRAKTFATKNDCGGNCMGSVPTATGSQVG